MQTRLAFTLLLLLLGIRTQAQATDQFYGPFASWSNVKTQFGARGDGISDDTRALQAALDAAGRENNSPVVYLPAGTYRISRSLVLDHQISISVIGADPSTTIIRWAGAPRGTLFKLNGTAYSKFDRITWDGSGTADIAIDQSWDGVNPHFDTGNEYADNIFTDVATGIRGGAAGHGFAETSILRDRFIRNTGAGISLGNFNALDIWITHCYFEDCGTGITNLSGAGNFKVYQCLFRRSAQSDIAMANTGEFTIRGNTSVQSAAFFRAAFTRNPSPTTVEDNIILEPQQPLSVSISNQGPILFLRNTFRSATRIGGPVVRLPAGSLCSANIFTVQDAIDAGSGSILRGNQVQPAAKLQAVAVPKLPLPPATSHSPVYEIPPRANAAVIQSIIDRAARKGGPRAILHFSSGSYSLEKSLIIRQGSDLVLTGDGMGEARGSCLSRTAANNDPLLKVQGPCRLVLSDLTLRGHENAVNLLISNADQPGARLCLQEFHQKNGQTGLRVSQQRHLQVLARDVAFSGLETAVEVSSDAVLESQVSILSGAGSNNRLSYKLSGTARLSVCDSWYEGSTPGVFADISGNARFFAQGNHIATPPGKTAISVHEFSGQALIAACDLTGKVTLAQASPGRVTLLGLLAEEQPFLAGPQATTAHLLLNRARNHGSTLLHGGSLALDDRQATDSSLFDDARPADPTLQTVPARSSAIILQRVLSVGGSTGLEIGPR